jgi:hypothetical protein
MKSTFSKLLILSLVLGPSIGHVLAQTGSQATGQSMGGGLEDLLKGASQPPAVVKKTVEVRQDQPQVVSGSYEEFLSLEKECKANNANSCLKAGNIMMAEKPPKEIYDLSSGKRATKALQLYERAIDLGNLQAMEAAYDLYYDPYPVQRLLNSYTDTDKAKELQAIMVSKNYSGGLARKAKDYLENPEYLLSIEKKKEGCEILRNLTSQPNMTDATKKIVENLNSSLICSVAKK